MVESLEPWGWRPFFQKELPPGLEIGRVIAENRGTYLLYTAHGEYTAEATGKLLYGTALPKAGDWVVIARFEAEQKAIIHEVLPRQSSLSRKGPDRRTEAQVLAANVDIVFIVQGLDDNFNLRRLDRFLVMVFDGGAEPVIILNKADLCPDLPAKVVAVQEVALQRPVIVTSATDGTGLETLRSFIKPGLTFAFIGSSGVGKSTLINKIVGQEVQATAKVRLTDSKGQHTTTRRELIRLPQGGVLIDTPGIRELQLWSSEAGLSEAFADITDLAANCHFSDCTHIHEAKCAVQAALVSGAISQARYASYLKLQKELAHTEQTQLEYLRKKEETKRLHRTFNRESRRKKW
jgi:ribosome biogenesis GTPase